MRSHSVLTGCLLVSGLLCAPTVMAMSDQQYLLAMQAMHMHDAPVASPATRAKPAQSIRHREVAYATINGRAVRG
ncbi:MAG: hypothetical protein ACRESQ_09765, partial [Gammaproteobacteria bacterium]